MMKFREPSFSLGFDRPSNCLGMRSFLLTGWNFAAGPIWHLGVRVLGVCLEAKWHQWTAAFEEEFRRFCAEEQNCEIEYEDEEWEAGEKYDRGES